MFINHFRAGTGVVFVETREERSVASELLRQLPDTADVHVCNAPNGPVYGMSLRDGEAVRDSEPRSAPAGAPALFNEYKWLTEGCGRVLLVNDLHVLVNTPGHWRQIMDHLDGIRNPRGTGGPSMIVAVGPHFDLKPENPLRGDVPVLAFEPPDRDKLRAIANSLCALPADEVESGRIIDALCGLRYMAAEQTCAEVLVGHENQWNTEALRAGRKRELQTAGLEIWPTTSDLGGLNGMHQCFTDEVIPWLRDDVLGVRRSLCAGVPGVGKSYCARYLGHLIGCEVVRLSLASLKAGIVGQSEGNLRRALATIDAMGKHSPLVVVLDEIDGIAEDGMDGGTSIGMFNDLLTWLEESTCQAIVIGTLNRLDNLKAQLESRFAARFFFALPTQIERAAVAKIHYERVGCEGDLDTISDITAQATDGFSSREIAQDIVPTVARRCNRNPDPLVIGDVCNEHCPVSKSNGEQLDMMRAAARSLRRANSARDQVQTGGRSIGTAAG